jgi:hypothetical protein
MASKAVTVGDLIHRAASSCLSNRLSCNYTLRDSGDSDLEDEDPFADAVSGSEECRHSPSAAEVVEELKIWEEGQQEEAKREATAAAQGGAERARDAAETLVAEAFDAVSGVRRAYAALQGAHCPWDPAKMRSADAAVVAELRHLARLRDRFRRSAAAAGRVPTVRPRRSGRPRRRTRPRSTTSGASSTRSRPRSTGSRRGSPPPPPSRTAAPRRRTCSCAPPSRPARRRGLSWGRSST